MSTTTPLTDAINALTTYANETTGASDTNLSDAVYTLAQGYGSGTPTEANDNDVIFYDYDGFRLYSYSAEDFLALNSMPSNPSHSGLTSQGWNWSLEDAKAQVTECGRADIGQMYATDDDTTRIYFSLDEGRLSPYLGICPNGTVTIDWGDGSATSSVTGTSTNTLVYAQHTYTSAGQYVISLTVDGSLGFKAESNIATILRADNSNTNQTGVYYDRIWKIEIGKNVPELGNACFRDMTGLRYITIPNTLTNFNGQVFYSNYSLEHVTVPSRASSIPQCYSAHAMRSISLPKVSFNLGYLSAARSNLRRYVIPIGATATSPQGLMDVETISEIVIPSSVTTISILSFSNCKGVKEYHLLPSTPPTLSDINAFTGIADDCIIFVPSGTLSAYQTANNWSTYASYMQEEY